MFYTDITFVIQGSVYQGITNGVIASVRKYFPKARIIFSTCNPRYTDTLVGYDDLIISPDVAYFTYADRPGEKTNNVNRQITTTIAGLKACKTTYAFKLRSDFFLTGKDFLDFFDKFPKYDNEYKIFEHKILSCCYFARNPASDMPFPFHPSDLAFFGETKDLIKLFDIPLMTREEAYYNLADRHQYQYVPEQYLFISCLKKNEFNINCDFYNDCNTSAIEQTERYFASNFIFLTFDQFNLKPTKPTFMMKVHPNAFKTCYTHIEWMRLYQKYVDPEFNVPQIDPERKRIERYYRFYKKYRLLGNICALPFSNKAVRRKIRNRVLEFFLNR